jgi:gliding motility-associated-like protein
MGCLSGPTELFVSIADTTFDYPTNPIMKTATLVRLILVPLILLCCMMDVRAQFFNGDFSLGTLGCSGGTGWTTASGTMSAQYADGRTPSNPWVDLTPCMGWGNGTYIEQAVPMVVGNCYYIEMDLASHCGWDLSDAGVYITLDGVPLGGRVFNDSILCGGQDYGWKRRRSMLFTAVNNPTIVRFTGEGHCIATVTGPYPCSAPGAIANPGVIAIDNIELVAVTAQTLNFSLGNDTVYCEPFSRMLDPNLSGSGTSYLWSTGDTTQTLLVDTPGTYWCRVTTMCGASSDTIRIGQSTAPVVDLGGDIFACGGDTVRLQPLGMLPGNVRYTWSTTATTPFVAVTQSGTYWVEVDNNGCRARDTISVHFEVIAVDLGPDFSLCESDLPVVLTSPQPAGATYLWSNGLSAPSMSVVRGGDHWLEVTIGGCTASDTIHITAVPDPFVYIGPDSTICEQFPMRTGTEIDGATYQWNTGATTPYIEVSTTGSYVLEVNLDGCVVYDTVNVTAMPAPTVDLGPNRDICPDETIVLDARRLGDSKYKWNTGDTTSSYSATAPGIYWVAVTTEHGCVGTDSIELIIRPLPEVRLGSDTVVCKETPLLLYPMLHRYEDSLIWSDGTVGAQLTVTYGGEYVITGINRCGWNADTIFIKQIFCDIWLPNAFTPNGDGVNDVFRVLGNIGFLEDVELSVYNRWGQRVFYTQDKYEGWDGMYNGEMAMLGTYVYQLQYSTGGKPYLQKGNFHLIR